MKQYNCLRICQNQKFPRMQRLSNAAGCIKAGNDLIMPGSQQDVDEIIRSVGVKDGEVEL